MYGTANDAARALRSNANDGMATSPLAMKTRPTKRPCPARGAPSGATTSGTATANVWVNTLLVNTHRVIVVKLAGRVGFVTDELTVEELAAEAGVPVSTV